MISQQNVYEFVTFWLHVCNTEKSGKTQTVLQKSIFLQIKYTFKFWKNTKKIVQKITTRWAVRVVEIAA